MHRIWRKKKIPLKNLVRAYILEKGFFAKSHGIINHYQLHGQRECHINTWKTRIATQISMEMYISLPDDCHTSSPTLGRRDWWTQLIIDVYDRAWMFPTILFSLFGFSYEVHSISLSFSKYSALFFFCQFGCADWPSQGWCMCISNRNTHNQPAGFINIQWAFFTSLCERGRVCNACTFLCITFIFIAVNIHSIQWVRQKQRNKMSKQMETHKMCSQYKKIRWHPLKISVCMPSHT